MVLFRFDRLSIAYIFGSYPFNMSFFFCLWSSSLRTLCPWQNPISRLVYSQGRETTTRTSFRVFSGTKISHSHRISMLCPAHSQGRDTVGPNITFRGFSTYIRDPRVQEILVITKPSVMSRIFFLSKVNASLNTGLPTVKYESHTPSQEIVKLGALQGFYILKSKLFESENAAKIRYRVVFRLLCSRTKNHKRYIQLMC